MIYRDPLRRWVSRNLAPIMFLSAYFITVVLGNIVFTLPFGRAQLRAASYTAPILQFHTLFSAGFWALLLIPFLVTPIVAKLIRSAMERFVHRVAEILPDFSRTNYAVITAACFGYVLFALWRADAFTLFSSGQDAVSSVQARFLIRAHTAFAALAVLMSVLHFLSLYSLIRWMRGDGVYWAAMTVCNVLIMSAFLIVLNMKWPVLLFYTGLILAVFVYAQQRPYLKATVGFVLLVPFYLLISAFVLRVVAPSFAHIAAPSSTQIPTPSSTQIPTPSSTQIPAPSSTQIPAPSSAQVPSPSPAPVTAAPAPAVPAARMPRVDAPPPAPSLAESPGVAESTNALTRDGRYSLRLAPQAAIEAAPRLVMVALNRMAMSYPYYYEVFTTEGAVCGGIIEQARVGVACRPSTLIYGRMFGDDGFRGRGTAPAAVHISGYALGGWPTAIFALVCASVILGMFACLPLDMNAMVSAFVITGGIVGYHFSQLPGEGPLIYDHGVLWVVLMLFLYAVARRIWVQGRALVGAARREHVRRDNPVP